MVIFGYLGSEFSLNHEYKYRSASRSSREKFNSIFPRSQFNSHARGFSGARTGLQTVLEPWASSDFVGKFWAILELAANSGSHLQGIPGIPGFLHHRTASFAGVPITDDKRCDVTQPCARINVSCSRAGQKRGAGVGGTARGPRQRRAKDSKGYQTRVPDRAGQGGTGTRWNRWCSALVTVFPVTCTARRFAHPTKKELPDFGVE